MPSGHAKRGVARWIAGGDKQVMHAGRIIALEKQQWATFVGDKMFTRMRKKAVDMDTGMLGAGILPKVVGTECKQIDSLSAFDIDHAKSCAGTKMRAAALPSRNMDELGHSLEISLSLDLSARRRADRRGYLRRSGSAVERLSR